jgi:hypothetical protein
MATTTYPDFSISRPFIRDVTTANKHFDRKQPITIHLRFAQDQITVLSMPEINQLLGRLLTMDGLLALVPDPTHVSASDFVAETNNVFIHALYDCWTTNSAGLSQGIRKVAIKQLTKEINDL